MQELSYRKWGLFYKDRDMKHSVVLATAVMTALLLTGNKAFADDCPDYKTDALTGDWGGSRSSLCEKGVAVELTHKSDLLNNASGGVARGGVVLMNSEVAVSFDLDKLAGLGGASAFVQYHVQHGDQTKDFNGSYVGSFAGVSNIETGISTGQFYQAWLQQNFAGDSLSALVGLYAVDSEFYVTDTSGLFLQPPYGMSAEMAQTGRNGPPVFPMGALGLRLKYTGDGYYAQAALTDGVPGNPNNAHGTQIRFDRGDGTLAVAEFGYTPEAAEGQYNKVAVGLWRYTARVADLAAVATQHADRGAYVIAERTLTAEQGDAAQGLSGFVRYGFVNKNVYQADWSGSIGLNYQGLFDGRDADAAGIAVTTSHASAKYRLLNGSKSSETVVELTYRAQLQPWLALQPSLQYIANPNMDPALQDSWVVGCRIEASF